MDNDVIAIYADDIEIAKNLCGLISDDTARSRAVANILAVKLAERYFYSKNIETDTVSGLYNLPNVLENLDIADIYVNGAYIDVRVYFSKDEISVPKFHFDFGMNPAAYMFIQLSSDLSDCRITGFIKPEHINKSNLKDDYYYIDENTLVSFYDVESYLTEVPDTFNGSKELLYSFVDGTIDEGNITELLKTLMSSANARRILIKAFKANSVFRFVSSVPKETVSYNENEQSESFLDDNEINTGLSEKDLEDVFDNAEPETSDNSFEYSTEVTPNAEFDNDDVYENIPQENDNSEQIDSLFDGEQKSVPVTKKSNLTKLIIAFMVILLASGTYYAYTHNMFTNNMPPVDNIQTTNNPAATDSNQSVDNAADKEDAMPNEGVVTTDANAFTEDASPVAIPAIEQHLDTSVLVANLKVDWEVPAGYASNTSAKRYLIKLGKVIQLNLKSELLLLNRPPISNKITVELKYNDNKGKFDIVGIKDSSGEKVVDDTILNTIKSALSISVSSNIESFGKLQGNPLLIIHL